MIRRINHTARKRIERKSLGIQLQRTSPVIATFSLDLSSYGFPEDAVVIAEAYGQSRNVRIELGAVGDGKISHHADLSPFTRVEEVHFRVKVIPRQPAEARLLGLAESVAPDTDGEAPARSLLPVRVSDLEQLVWRVEYEQAGPVLEVNRGLLTGTAYLRQPHFVALAQIEILRQILLEALRRGGEEEGAEGDSWQTRWIKLGERLASRHCDSDGDLSEDHYDWIRDACEAFARERQALSKLNQMEVSTDARGI